MTFHRKSFANTTVRPALAATLALVLLALLGARDASAETVTGTFRYADRDAGTGAITMRPIVAAKVEIHRLRPRGVFWSHDATTTTDRSGRISLPMRFAEPGVKYAVKVFATNYAAVVWPNDFLHTVPFHREPGAPDGHAFQRTAARATDVLDFSYDFREEWSSQHYNIAETVRRGFDYVAARRDPAERDRLPPAPVQPTSLTNTWFNPIADTVVITTGDTFADLLILHEWAHFVEQHIGMFLPLPANHDGCNARLLGANLTYPGYAWMEGFADFLAHAVDLASPPGVLTGTGVRGTTFTRGQLEAPGPCSASPDGDRIELRVAGALWDLADTRSDPGALPEPHDTLARFDRHVIQILDRELDPPPAIVRRAPELTAFRHAWMRRGLPGQALARIYQRLAIPLRRRYPPTAFAGATQRVVAGERVRLDGGLSSDPDLRPLRFHWTAVEPAIQLAGRDTVRPSFTAPSVRSTTRTTFRLTVTDGTQQDTDHVTVIVDPR